MGVLVPEGLVAVDVAVLAVGHDVVGVVVVAVVVAVVVLVLQGLVDVVVIVLLGEVQDDAEGQERTAGRARGPADGLAESGGHQRPRVHRHRPPGAEPALREEVARGARCPRGPRGRRPRS